MTSKTKYSIIALAVVGLIFLIFSSVKWRYWELGYLLIAKVLYLLGIICVILYFKLKGWRKILAYTIKTTFSISLLLSAYLSYAYFERDKHIQIIDKYERASCKELKKLFLLDLKNQDIKYFQYGMGADIKLHKRLTKYNVVSYWMGDVKFSTIDCYNEMVNQYLIENYKDTIFN